MLMIVDRWRVFIVDNEEKIRKLEEEGWWRVLSVFLWRNVAWLWSNYVFVGDTDNDGNDFTINFYYFLTNYFIPNHIFFIYKT